MSFKVTQKEVDRAIEQLRSVSKLDIEPYNCYGYYQLRQVDGSTINSTLGSSKKELYTMIQFYIRMKELESSRSS